MKLKVIAIMLLMSGILCSDVLIVKGDEKKTEVSKHEKKSRAELLKLIKRLEEENKDLQKKIFALANQQATLRKEREPKWIEIDPKNIRKVKRRKN